MNTAPLYGTALHVKGYVEAPPDMEVAGRSYPVAGMVEVAPGVEVPLLDIPMMSDFNWQLEALVSRLQDPERYKTALGEDVPAVISRLCDWLWAHIENATPTQRKILEGVRAA